MLRLMRALARDRKGATAIEYGLIVSLVIIAMIVALTNFANTSVGMWNNISNKVQNPN
jgi:pilus assembly protein Flp/PilA